MTLKKITFVVNFVAENSGALVIGITEILNIMLKKNASLLHLETRKAKSRLTTSDSCFISLTIDEESLISLQSEIERIQVIRDVSPLVTESTTEIWIPQHISELDRCQHLQLKIQPELQTDHPGFHDQIYRKRRREIAELAFNYHYGDPLPNLKYNDQEVATWQQAYSTLKSFHNAKACSDYIEGFKLLEEHGIYGPNAIPQLEAVSRYLEGTSGFRLRPVAGLVSSRDFLAHFAFRVFPCTQYIRHSSRPSYTPEPDVIHELLGHVPMLVSRKFADFAHEIGLASLGVPDDILTKLATIFWFTIEFGLCLENNETRAIGAGILSSYGEMTNAFTETSEKRPFDPHEAALQNYDTMAYQVVYYVCDSVERMKEQLNEYIHSLPKSTWTQYDPVTSRIKIRDLGRTRSDFLDQIGQLLHAIKLLDDTEMIPM